jgi:hypothetical protein
LAGRAGTFVEPARPFALAAFPAFAVAAGFAGLALAVLAFAVLA